MSESKRDDSEETVRNGEPGKALRVKCECGQWTTYDPLYADKCFLCVSRKAGL